MIAVAMLIGLQVRAQDVEVKAERMPGFPPSPCKSLSARYMSKVGSLTGKHDLWHGRVGLGFRFLCRCLDRPTGTIPTRTSNCLRTRRNRLVHRICIQVRRCPRHQFLESRLCYTLRTIPSAQAMSSTTAGNRTVNCR